MKSKKKADTLRQVASNVYLMTYDSRYDLCMSFVRVQEFYESPEFKGKYFTLEEFIDWWSIEMSKIKGSFDYPARWSGFNVPGEIILDWLFECDEDELRGREIDLLKKLAKRLKVNVKSVKTGQCFHTLLKDKLKGIYLIGCSRYESNTARRETVAHEVAHALYTLYPEYRKKCQNLILKMKKNIDDKLIYECAVDTLDKMGYDKCVIDDEVQAYFSTGNKFGIREAFVSNLKDFKKKVKNK